jgi:homoserine kinase
MYDQFTAEPADEWHLEVRGEAEEEVPLDETNRVIESMKALFEVCGEPELTAAVSCITRIPTGRGLGSSSAATIAGLLLANGMAESPVDEETLFRMAARIEGHADNSAAALHGGFTLTWNDDEGLPRAVQLEPCEGVATVAVVSESVLRTPEARSLLPELIPRKDAAFNVGRAGILAAGLLLGKPELARPGLEDRLHQPYRAEYVDDFESVRRILMAAGSDGAVLSGAGPTVLGILLDTDDSTAFSRAVRVAEKATELLSGLPNRRAPVALPVDRRGASVL